MTLRTKDPTSKKRWKIINAGSKIHFSIILRNSLMYFPGFAVLFLQLIKLPWELWSVFPVWAWDSCMSHRSTLKALGGEGNTAFMTIDYCGIFLLNFHLPHHNRLFNKSWFGLTAFSPFLVCYRRIYQMSGSRAQRVERDFPIGNSWYLVIWYFFSSFLSFDSLRLNWISCCTSSLFLVVASWSTSFY